MRTTQNCDYCGDYLGLPCERYGNEPVTCGKQECESWARDQDAADREEAHRRLDDEMGYGRF